MKVLVNKTVNFEKDDFIWRYLDFHKLISFLLDKHLFFTRLDNFDDPLEGLTENILGNLVKLESSFENEERINPLFSEEEKQDILTQRENRKEDIILKSKNSQQTQFANCWFVGKKESFAMWNMYSDINSVAIRYQPKELLDIVIPSAESYKFSDFDLFIYGFVDYYDIWPFDIFKKSENKIEFSSFVKDLSYVHEREFRFIASTPKVGRYDKFELPLGDISKDNFRIYANPYMEDWKFKNLIRLLEKISINNKLYKSELKVKK